MERTFLSKIDSPGKKSFVWRLIFFIFFVAFLNVKTRTIFFYNKIFFQQKQ